MERVKKYLINPVDKQDTDFSDKDLVRELPSAKDVETLDGFTDLDDE